MSRQARSTSIVVYKIDRLTRSLADFARMVELFDKQDASFVSITQSFNTTSSMGRLTLNVLLSFAQFEREVTDERIRDKIAASKAKGLWMAGVIPLGFDLPAEGTRTLRINEPEAENVRTIFARYLELGSVHVLRDWLEAHGITPKQWTAASGKPMGAASFSRGALFHLLRNPVYLGCIRHKGVVHDGGHPAIIDRTLFDQVQARLDHRAQRRRDERNRVARAPLTGRIFDAGGEPMSPSFAHGRKGRLYRYYVSSSLQKGENRTGDRIQRLPGPALEAELTKTLSRLLPGHRQQPLDRIRRLVIHEATTHVIVDQADVADSLPLLEPGERITPEIGQPGRARIELPMRIRNRRGRTRIDTPGSSQVRPDPVLIAALRKAHGYLEYDTRHLPLCQASPDTQYERRIVRLAFLAPDLQEAMINGRQPAHINLERLVREPIPICWQAQRAIFGGG